jgi:radical SAM protein (TIGR01212 family)
MMDYFYSFNAYLREKFGERVHRISIDAGFTCPNIDGTVSDLGCTYCNNKGFAQFAGKRKSIEEQIDESMAFYRARMGVSKFIVYFQAFSNTYADVATLRQRFEVIRKYPDVVGLSISTRPDCIDEAKIALISEYSKDYLVWLEYGLQTTDNHVLRLVNRHHTYENFLKAYSLARVAKINVGVHMILGLPSQGREEMLVDARRIGALDIQGIKFHVLHVLKDTPLEDLYKKNEVQLLSAQEYISLVCDYLECIPAHVAVLRLVSTAAPEYLVAPGWVNQKVVSPDAINKEFEKRGTRQGSRFAR